MHIVEDFTPVADVVSIADSTGADIKVSDFSRETKLPDSIQVVVEATHTGINKNKVSYSYESLELSTDSWTNNYSKPVLLNHDMSSDPMGRVVNSVFKQSVIEPQKYCIQLTLEIQNKAAIERFLDGRYKTFSIGGYTDSAKCSVCGKDMIADGFCGHQRGKKYDDKECYWHLGRMDYDEISVVNSPADVHAQALSVDIVETDEKDSKSDDSVSTDDTTKLSDNKVSDSVLDNIDEVLGKTDDSAQESNEEGSLDEDNQGDKSQDSTPDGNEGNLSETETETEGVQEDNETQEDKQVDRVAELESTIEDMKKIEQELRDRLEEKDGEIAQKDMKIEGLSSELSESKDANKTLTSENQYLSDKNLNISRFAHSTLASNVANLQIALNEKNVSDRDNLIKEYSTFTSKKLNDMIAELTKPEKIINRATVTTPGVISDGDTESGAKEAHENSIHDYANSMINFMVR